MSYYRAHIFVCKNQKDNQKKCCQNSETDKLFDYLKQKISILNGQTKKKIRLSYSGCLGRCEKGPLLVIYPEQLWYTYQNEAEINEIMAHYLSGGQANLTHLLFP